MLENQKKYLNYLNNIEIETNQIDLLKNKYNNLKSVITKTELLVPIIGAFSSGKSTLLNSFLDSQILPVGITPETAIATEIRYSEENFIEAVKGNGVVDKYSVDEMFKIKEKSREYKFIRLRRFNPQVRQLGKIIKKDFQRFLKVQ